eukprot:TRINITY_DN16781_c0_g1_i1.p1 TRINITY_DN16781_c0_g1~~TRINITY_DN16781_c0_g1_i1.p1  ORF type:complete len:294 (+),score=42.11 TRINITY_DN16781_c0_g1_i1:125-1006(+)
MIIQNSELPPLSELISQIDEWAEVYSAFPNIVEITPSSETKVHIMGDVHGCIKSFNVALGIIGDIGPENWLVVNGDFIDRGTDSVPIVSKILELKSKFPEFVHINRGNHELVSFAKAFVAEVRERFDEEEADHYLRASQKFFESLPLGIIIPDSCFIVHGGIPRVLTLDEMNSFDRKANDSPSFLLLWCDPWDKNGIKPNRARGIGRRFGPDVTAEFLDSLDLKFMIRSHQTSDSGFIAQKGSRCFTVFSASHYEGDTNMGAVMSIQNNKLTQTSFDGYSDEVKTTEDIEGGI